MQTTTSSCSREVARVWPWSSGAAMMSTGPGWPVRPALVGLIGLLGHVGLGVIARIGLALRRRSPLGAGEPGVGAPTLRVAGEALSPPELHADDDDARCAIEIDVVVDEEPPRDLEATRPGPALRGEERLSPIARAVAQGSRCRPAPRGAIVAGPRLRLLRAASQESHAEVAPASTDLSGAVTRALLGAPLR